MTVASNQETASRPHRLRANHLREASRTTTRAHAPDALTPGEPSRSPQRLSSKQIRQHLPALHTRAMQLCHDRDLAWDLVQQTLEHALHADASRIPPNRIRGWLHVILRNTFIDELRARRRFVRLEPALEEQLALPEEAPLPIWARLDLDDVRAGLDKIDARFRGPYELHALRGLPYEAISSQLGMPLATIGTRILRTKRLLRTLLDDAS